MSRALLVVACCVWVGCSDDHDGWRSWPAPQRPEATGSLEYHWSINGRQVAQDCEAVGALLFESVVIDHGFIVDGIDVPCEDFEATLPLYRDDFLARSSLTNRRGRPALGRVIEDFFVINDAEVTTLVLDFPSGSLSTTPDAGVPGPVDAGTIAPNTPDATPPVEPVVDAGADGG